jgi:hypothetical protein
MARVGQHGVSTNPCNHAPVTFCLTKCENFCRYFALGRRFPICVLPASSLRIRSTLAPVARLSRIDSLAPSCKIPVFESSSETHATTSRPTCRHENMAEHGIEIGSLLAPDTFLIWGQLLYTREHGRSRRMTITRNQDSNLCAGSSTRSGVVHKRFAIINRFSFRI